MSTGHRGDYCAHKDKMCMTRSECAVAVRSMSKGKYRMTAYNCEHCGHWHIAHARPAGVRHGQQAKAHGKAKRNA